MAGASYIVIYNYIPNIKKDIKILPFDIFVSPKGLVAYFMSSQNNNFNIIILPLFGCVK